ncbi:MAG: restriction endonuclease [Thaumarchaeota archaeon]|nr:restriction endonuclease [Nitrososphaerota archaeon]
MIDKVAILKDNAKIVGFSVNGKEFRCSPDLLIIDARIEDLTGFKIGSIPKDFAIVPVGKDSDIFDGMIYSAGGNEPFSAVASIYFEVERMYWYHDFSMEKYFGAMKQALEARKESEYDVEFDDVESNDFFVRFDYMIFLEQDLTADKAVRHFANVVKEIDGDTERILQREDISQETLKDEERFTLEVLLPLFRRMNFLDVHYNHGQREFGKDITFSEIDKFGQRRNYGVQVKAGDISGRARSDLNGVIDQANEAFPHEYIDTSSRERRFISDLIIAISGHFTDKAKEKILEEVRVRNVHFFDIDKIEELLVRYGGKRIKRTTQRRR